MAESQSRYSIIKELTESMNNERETISIRKTELETHKIEILNRDTTIKGDLVRQITDFNSTWDKQREAAKNVEKAFDLAKKDFETNQNKQVAKLNIDIEVLKRNVELEEKNIEGLNASSELKIAELKDSIESLKQVSKESSKNVESAK